jgi:ferredoxin-NADP reductase
MTAHAEEAVRRCVVTARTEVAQDVVSLTLRHADGHALPRWTPGSHVDLLLPGGLVRQYSLCGGPAHHEDWRLGVLREPAGRGGSALVHDEVHEGTELDVRGPRNHFVLERSPRYLFIAGGIGITPILPMVAAAQAAGAEWELLYGGRSAGSMAFLDELVEHGDRVAVRPQDEHGLLDLDAALGDPADGTLVYCCGPEPLLNAVEERCAGWPPGSLHVERFAAKEIVVDAAAEGRFEVVLELSGQTLVVEPGTSILDTVRAAGVEVPSSCEEGICGTCETDVLEGIPDHRDSVLSPEAQQENDAMMICCSRSRTPQLVLDL